MFIDQVKIFLSSGKGGNGCVSFRREKYVEFGGPNGGHGGTGGNIIFTATKHMNTLNFFRYRQHFRAQNGSHGMGKNMTGKAGEDLIIKVPIGTQIWDEHNEYMIHDIINDKEEMLFMQGGFGGAGNASQKNSINRAPKTAMEGLPGEQMFVWLKMKIIADIGIIGLANAGKSTLLSRITNANPKIANYPFTTLYPQLGILQKDDREIVLADLPGLIEGASTGKGLGHRFLGHIERCNVLLHLIDITSDDILRDYNIVRNELQEYMPSLCYKKEIIVFNKCDLINNLISDYQNNNNTNVFQNAHYISSMTMCGIKELCELLYNNH